MIEFIKIAIMALFAGILMPLPVSSSAHVSLLNRVMNFSSDTNTLTFYSAIFSISFALVVMFNLRSLYVKGISSMFVSKEQVIKKKLINYNKFFINVLICIIPIFVLFVPISKDEILMDQFGIFMTSNNLVLTAIASIISGLILFVSFWYSKVRQNPTHKIAQTKEVVKFSLCQLAAYIIPGLSHVSCASANMIISDINSNSLVREVYAYLAPQLLVVNLISLIRVFTQGYTVDIIATVIAILVSLAVCALMMNLISKVNIKKLFSFFAAYSIVFGIYIAITTFIL